MVLIEQAAEYLPVLHRCVQLNDGRLVLGPSASSPGPAWTLRAPGERISFPHAPAAATSTVTPSPDRLDLAVAAFLVKILMSAFFVRDRPGRPSPRKSKKAPARCSTAKPICAGTHG